MVKTLGFIKGIFPGILLLSIFVVSLLVFIAFARGYRFDFTNQKLTSTGILSVSASPKPAKVFVNGELKGATDINLPLPNGQYVVELQKDGYTSWKKSITLKGEIVMSLDPVLFPKNPSLKPLTNLGVVNALPVGHSNRLLLFSQNDTEKDGVYLFELGKTSFTIFPPLKPIILRQFLPANLDLKKTTVDFSPDYSEGIFTFFYKDDQGSISYQLNLNETTDQPFDVTSSKDTLLAVWQEEKNKELLQILETLPRALRPIATEAFRVVAFSPDETKIFYQAKNAVVLPLIIKPQLIGANQSTENRTLEPGKFYIYDLKEDKNFLLPIDDIVTPADILLQPTLFPTPIIDPTETIEPLPQFVLDEWFATMVWKRIQWFPDSRHFVLKEKGHFSIMDYDGTNKVTVYAGPFEEDLFALSPDWNLVILANLNPQNNVSADLYSVGIR